MGSLVGHSIQGSIALAKVDCRFCKDIEIGTDPCRLLHFNNVYAHYDHSTIIQSLWTLQIVSC